MKWLQIEGQSTKDKGAIQRKSSRYLRVFLETVDHKGQGGVLLISGTFGKDPRRVIA